MIDVCMALDQSVSPHTGVRTIQNTGVFWQAVFQPPRPYSLFLEHGSAAKTLISHPHNTTSYAGYKFSFTTSFSSLNPLSSKIHTHTLVTVFYTFLMVLLERICSNIETFHLNNHFIHSNDLHIN